MKKPLVLLISIFSTLIFSQNETIAGSYHQSNGNPEGGTVFIVLPNNTFVVGYFGGMRKGTWQLLENNTYEFKYHAEPKVVLYGRSNPTLKDSVAIDISLDENRGLAVRFNNTENDDFIPVFNKNANCFDYPYIYKQVDELSLLEVYIPDFRRYYKGDLKAMNSYNFKIEEDYNEFILTGLSEEYSNTESFIANYNAGILSLGENRDLKKSSLYEDLDSETKNYIEAHTKTEILPKILEYGNEFFPNYDNPKANDLIPFTRIEPKIQFTKGINISKESLFTANCEDD